MKYLAAAFVFAAALLGSAFIDVGRTQPRVVVLDVGQGDAIYVRTPDGQDLLIDAGPSSGHVVERLREELPRGDAGLELVVATHLDADHSGGMVDVLDAFQVDRVATNGAAATTKTGEAFLAAAAVEGSESSTLQAGQRLSGKSWFADVLWPAAGYKTTETNDVSVVLKLQTAGHCLLLTGDISDRVERTLVEDAAPLQCELLKVPHHGSKTSSSAAFLEAVAADQAIISVGAKNKYGHPTQEALDRLRDVGAEIHRTDQEGSVTVAL